MNPPFMALSALGLWYGYCLESEISNWWSNHGNHQLGAAKDCAVFSEHPHGYHIRRVLCDGKLLKVYDGNNRLLDDTLLPLAVPGNNIHLLNLDEVVPFLKSRGALYCHFSIRGLSYKGHVLSGEKYCAAWSDDQRGFLFETDKGPNPNAKILEEFS